MHRLRPRLQRGRLRAVLRLLLRLQGRRAGCPSTPMRRLLLLLLRLLRTV